MKNRQKKKKKCCCLVSNDCITWLDRSRDQNFHNTIKVDFLSIFLITYNTIQHVKNKIVKRLYCVQWLILLRPTMDFLSIFFSSLTICNLALVNTSNISAYYPLKPHFFNLYKKKFNVRRPAESPRSNSIIIYISSSQGRPRPKGLCICSLIG